MFRDRRMADHDRTSRAVPAWLIALIVAAAPLLLGPMSGAFAAPDVAVEQQASIKFTVIPVEGMICISCAATIKRAVKNIPGVFHVEVSLEDRTARVSYVPAKVSAESIVAAINKLGYRAGAPQEAQ